MDIVFGFVVVPVAGSISARSSTFSPMRASWRKETGIGAVVAPFPGHLQRRTRVRLPLAVAEPPAAPRAASTVPSLSKPVLAGNEFSSNSSNIELSSSTGLEGGAASSGEEQIPFRVGQAHTRETRQKISAANKGKTPWNKGRKHSPETRRKIAEATRRAMQNVQTRKKLSASATGRKHSQATKAKIATACLQSRAVVSVRIASGEKKAKSTKPRSVPQKPVLRKRVRSGPLPFDYPRNVVAALNANIHEVAKSELFKKTPLGSGGRILRGSTGRRPMSKETKEKLSKRIKDMWKDPAYRNRVRSGLQEKYKGGVRRGPLSDEHRNRIRRSLLERNASLRASGLAPPKKERSSRGVRRRRVRTKSDSSGLHAIEENVQVLKDVEELSPSRSSKKDEEARHMQAKKERQAEKLAKEAEALARKQREQDCLLLDILASTGQLPPLNPDANVVCGELPSASVVFGPGGSMDTGFVGVYESELDGSISPPENGAQLVFSSGDLTGGATASAGLSSGFERLETQDGEMPLDFDIYAPRMASLREDGEDDSYLPESGAGLSPSRVETEDDCPGSSSSESVQELEDGSVSDRLTVLKFENEDDVESVIAAISGADSTIEPSEHRDRVEVASREDERTHDVVGSAGLNVREEEVFSASTPGQADVGGVRSELVGVGGRDSESELSDESKRVVTYRDGEALI